MPSLVELFIVFVVLALMAVPAVVVVLVVKKSTRRAGLPTTGQPTPVAGWHPDPQRQGVGWRWWDGTVWTDRTELNTLARGAL